MSSPLPPSTFEDDERSARSSRSARSARSSNKNTTPNSSHQHNNNADPRIPRRQQQQRPQRPRPQQHLPRRTPQAHHPQQQRADPEPQGGGPAIQSSSSSVDAIHTSDSTLRATTSSSSPLPPMVQRSLGDRSNEKRKNAALEVEALIKSLLQQHPQHDTNAVANNQTIHAIIHFLAKDFCTSMNSNYRKGGLLGLAATATGLQVEHAGRFLPLLLPPVLHCFDDPESRVRFYACESLYNMAKVARQAILTDFFNPIFEGLTKLFADVDDDVKNGANLLDRLVKDIVTESAAASKDSGLSLDQFLPLLQNYIRRTNPYIRQLIVGWITLLDSLPDVSMLDYLPEFLDGLFNMLSDSNREIRQAADSALSDFLRELSVSEVLEFGPIIAILVSQCQSSKERLNRLTAITWLAELTHHPLSGGDALLPFSPEILSAILVCISDHEKEIRLVAERTNDDLLSFVKETSATFDLQPLLQSLTTELSTEDVPTKLAALRWINMLMEKRTVDMQVFTSHLLPVLLRTLSDPSDAVVLLDLQVLSRISLAENTSSDSSQFQLVLNAILNLFAQDRQLLETRGSLIIRKLCVLLNAKAVYIRMAETLSSYEFLEKETDDLSSRLTFISTMVQTLNLILLTASELHDLRSILSNSFDDNPTNQQKILPSASAAKSAGGKKGDEDNGNVFAALFHCWCHNPVSTFSLCLLAKAYDLSFCLVQRFSEYDEVTVGFLMQIDKLVHLLESPIFIHLRLSLLHVEAPYHAHLLKSIYGVLMCLPQGDAFRLLNDRLTTVCNLRDNLLASPLTTSEKALRPIVNQRGLDMVLLLERYDSVSERHRRGPTPPVTLPAAAAMEPAGSSPSRATASTTNESSTINGGGFR